MAANLEKSESEVNSEPSGQEQLEDQKEAQEALSAPGEDEKIDEEPSSLSEGEPEKDNKLERILSVKVPIIVKISEKSMTIREVLRFHLGSVIQFDQDAYQHVDLMVNNSTVGLGQPVKIGEHFGLRITQIKDITDTIKSLGGES